MKCTNASHMACISWGVSNRTILNQLLNLYDFPHRNGFVRGFELELENGHCVVRGLDKKSPAGQAGLEDGDVVATVNGEPVPGMTSWAEKEAKFNARTPVTLTVLRGERKEQKTFRFTFSPWQAPDVDETLWKKVGLKVRPMTEEEIGQFELKSPFAYLITDVDAQRFERLEHKPQVNDVLGKIAWVRPRDFDHFARHLDRLNAGDKIPMVVLRVEDEKTKQSVMLTAGQNAPKKAERKTIKTRIDYTDFEVK